jgi:hypothetical protein
MYLINIILRWFEQKNTPREGATEGIEFRMCRFGQSGWNRFKFISAVKQIFHPTAVVYLLFDSAILSYLQTLQKTLSLLKSTSDEKNFRLFAKKESRQA